jgi:hypothetical protein
MLPYVKVKVRLSADIAEKFQMANTLTPSTFDVTPSTWVHRIRF